MDRVFVPGRHRPWLGRSAALLLLSCAADSPGSDSAACESGRVPSDYVVAVETTPATIVAGEEVELTLAVMDEEGCPVDDLQESHERMVHTVLISRDLESFQHLHHEDFYAITADDLRAATFHFPVTFPAAGEVLAVFDFAHRNQWLQETSPLDVTGEPAQRDAPNLDVVTEVTVDDVHVSVAWDVEPVAGAEAAVTLTLTEEPGMPVTDLVPWLGADGHVVFVRADLASPGHTHAWFPGMDAMSPGMKMTPLYPGPTLPFHYLFPTAGTWKAWFQFARSGRPDEPYVVPIVFEVK
jgi:hypothetical protein